MTAETVLTFQLAATLAAMGEIAVGERRGSWDRPARSAVFGLIAACLGLDRADEAAHLALDRDYGLALRVQGCGGVLADYHTAQAPSARRGRRFATRAQELAAPDLNTILSRRDYRAEVLCFAAAWPRTEAPRWGLSELAEALRAPRFTPYLGRKSCPFSLPFDPVLANGDPVAALEAHARRLAAKNLPSWVLPDVPVSVTIDADAAAGHTVLRCERRRDRLASRVRWQFALREEAVLAS